MTFSQLKRIFFLLLTLGVMSVLLSACSGKKKNSKDSNFGEQVFGHDFFPNYKAVWFDNGSEKYDVRDRNGYIQKHQFFDPDPEIEEGTKELNFVVTTPVESQFHYKIDVVSGMTYKKYKYCKQTDVSGSYTDPIILPPYTHGVIPKVLDRLGETQQIIVFGNDEFYKDRKSFNFKRVRVIGGLIEQLCETGQCTGARSWQTRMLVVAVDPEDSKFKNVTSIDELKTKVDWPYVSAFIENGRGRNIIAKKSFPGYRISGMINSRQMIRYLRKTTKTFTAKSLFKMRKSCHKLYDFVWEHIGELPKKKKLKLNRKSIRELVTKINKIKEKFKKSNKKYEKHKRYDFKENFKAFYLNFADYYNTCTTYVKTSNVNSGYERHWFFAYFTAVMKLFKLGYYYSCDSQAWFFNPLDEKGKQTYDITGELNRCVPRVLNKAFIYSISFMSNIKLSARRYFRYIDYDNGEGGTHHKLYTWVPVDSKRLVCDKEFSQFKKKTREKRINDIFPKDIYWKPL